MASSTSERLPYIGNKDFGAPDAITALLCRLRLNRIRIDTDMKLRASVGENATYAADHGQFQREMFHTDQLLVCVERLSEPKTLDEFYVALQEVLGNVVGAEHFALLRKNSERPGWTVATHCGVDATDVLEGERQDAFAKAVRCRRTVNADGPHGPVFVPMLSGEDVEAVLVIFEWLPQQRTNAVADQSAVLQLLRAHGGALLLNAATCDRVQGE